MGVIERAMKENRHICSDKHYAGQTWEQFEKGAAGKSIYLFGTGAGASVYFKRLNNRQKLTGIIDNDPNKQGICAGEVIAETLETEIGSLEIDMPSVLEELDKDNLIVIVSGIYCYEEMIQQLYAMGIRNIYVLLIMEANQRIECKSKKEDSEEYAVQTEYVQKCLTETKINEKKIVFWAFNSYCDHGKYITEQLVRLRQDIDIVWIVDNLKIQVPKGVRLIYVGNWKRYIYEMTTAKVWIFNAVAIPKYIIKREQQIYIQTKHWASVTLKRFYLDAKTITDIQENVSYWIRDGKMMDYIFTGSKFDTESCQRGFRPAGEIVQIGSPRSDALFYSEALRKKVYQYYNLDNRIHTLLYAPTYRYNKEKAGHVSETRNIDMDYAVVKATLEHRFGGEWRILLRLHPGREKDIKGKCFPQYVLDVSQYSDGEELVAASDILISDYSSIMFEPAFVRKPVFLFATDKNEYIDNEYDLLIDYNTLPFDIAESNEELVKKIEQFDQSDYEQRVEHFLEKYDVHEDGRASERASRFICRLIDGK